MAKDKYVNVELICLGSFDLLFKVRLTLGQILMRDMYSNFLICHQITLH